MLIFFLVPLIGFVEGFTSTSALPAQCDQCCAKCLKIAYRGRTCSLDDTRQPPVKHRCFRSSVFQIHRLLVFCQSPGRILKFITFAWDTFVSSLLISSTSGGRRLSRTLEMLLSAKGFLSNQNFSKEAEDLLIFYKV